MPQLVMVAVIILKVSVEKVMAMAVAVTERVVSLVVAAALLVELGVVVKIEVKVALVMVVAVRVAVSMLVVVVVTLLYKQVLFPSCNTFDTSLLLNLHLHATIWKLFSRQKNYFFCCSTEAILVVQES